MWGAIALDLFAAAITPRVIASPNGALRRRVPKPRSRPAVIASPSGAECPSRDHAPRDRESQRRLAAPSAQAAITPRVIASLGHSHSIVPGGFEV
jgi:hypothetical protein